MVEDLLMQYSELQEQAIEHLDKAVRMGNLRQAWEVFVGLTPLLPKEDWIPGEDKFPRFRQWMDKNCYIERHQQFTFFDLIEDAVHFFFDEEETEDYEGFSKEQIEDIMWELLRNGRGQFTYDW